MSVHSWLPQSFFNSYRQNFPLLRRATFSMDFPALSYQRVGVFPLMESQSR